ncbi:BspA family leucine-rich repeat surface protein, partial [Actinotignum schaalii]
MPLKKRHCGTGGETEPEKIVFTPNSGQKIIFSGRATALFKDCVNAEIDLPSNGIDTSQVSNMREMFMDTPRANPDVSNWDVGNCHDFTRMFTGSGANPDVSRWNVSRKADYQWMFFGALNATFIDITNWTFPQNGTIMDRRRTAEHIFHTFSRTTLRLKGEQFCHLRSLYSIAEFDPSISYEIVKEENFERLSWDIPGDRVRVFFAGNSNCGRYQDKATYLLRPMDIREITVKADPITIYTGDKSPNLTYEISPSGLGDQLEGELETTYSNGMGPGEYPISQGGLRLKRSALSTYSLKFVPSILTVKEKPAQPPAQVTATDWVDGAKDCNTRKVSQSRTVTTTPHRWDSSSRKWVLDTAKASKKTETRQRDMNDGEHRQCTPQPPAQVTATNWVDGDKDCNTRRVSQSRTVTTTPYRWDSSSRKWVPDTSKASQKTESRQRDMNDGEHRACTPQPNPQVTTTNWVDGAKDCNTRKVTQSRTVTTTPHRWDSSSRQWVLDTSKASQKTETRQRDMNDGEHRECTPQPPAQVTATNWVDGAKDCNTRKVTQSRTVTTTPHRWDSSARKWVLDTSKASQKTETRQRDMNDGEHRACTPQPQAQVTATNWADGAKDCNTRKVTQSRTVTTTPHRWDSGSRKWVLDTAKASKKTETRQREMNDGEHRACTPQPQAQVTATNWVDGAKDCNTRKVNQSRTVTTTPYKWDSGKRQWVPDNGKASKKTETRQRDMNDNEHRACTPQPPAQVTATNWVDGAKDCNTRKVSQSRTVTTTPHKWDSGARKWVLDTSKASKKTESRQRDMNDGEHRQCTPQPPAQVTATNWVDGAKDCNTRKVTQSRTVTTTPSKWDSGKRQWVLDNAAATKKTETRQRDMNDGEHRQCTPQPPAQVTATNWVDGAKD